MPIYSRVVTAVSAVVTAVSAVVLAVVVMSGNATVRVEQLRTFDRLELSNTVWDQVRERYPDSGVGGWSRDDPPCPGSVAIKEGVRFACTFENDGKKRTVPVYVKDTYSGEVEVSAPTP